MRVLFVSPRFVPVNTPDIHRARLTAPYGSIFGWDVEILTVDAAAVDGPRDPWLLSGFPREIPVHHASALSSRWSRVPGLGSIGTRALSGLRRTGDKLLATGRFDLVYFTTTAFEVHVLGPSWKKRFGVPFVMDYQDPWVTDYYREHPRVRPPGGRLKYALAGALNRRLEPRVLRQCAGITSVSPDYPAQLVRRYPWLTNLRSLVAPFPAPTRDVARFHAETALTTTGPKRSTLRWVYVGVVPPMMEKSLNAFFEALSQHGDKTLLDRLRLEFIGTSYAPVARAVPAVRPIAERYGLSHLVSEQLERVAYVTALREQANADAILVFGTDDPHYTASKIYSCLLARKPLMAIFHQQSSVVDLMRRVGGGVIVPFSTNEPLQDLAARIGESWFFRAQYREVVPLDEEAFAPYSDKASAGRLCQFFDDCLRVSA